MPKNAVQGMPEGSYIHVRNYDFPSNVLTFADKDMSLLAFYKATENVYQKAEAWLEQNSKP